MLELSIGRLSNGNIVFLDLIQSHNIFISYFNAKQLALFLKSIAECASKSDHTILYLAINSRYKNYFIDKEVKLNVCQTYFFDKPFRSTLKNKSEFIISLHKEYKRRIRVKRKKEKQKTIIVIIENIWNIIQNISRSSGSKLIELLSESHTVEIHFIIASSTSYYNLFNQIIQPRRKKEENIDVKVNIQENGIRKTGAEIIYSSDGLIFLKYHNSFELNRLYKL